MKTTAVLCLVLFVGLAISTCVNDCNSHGTCSNGVCICSSGYGGSDCSIWDHAITPGETATGHLNTFQWHYYHVALPNGAAAMQVNVTQTSTFGDIDLFLAPGYYPDTTNYAYKDQSTARVITTEVSPVASGTWYIGLYGYWSADYTITLSVSSSCAHDCGQHGYCSGGNCVCYTPFTGDDCSIYDMEISSGTLYTNTVPTGQWMYYHIDVALGNNLEITLTQTDNSYDVDLYVKLNERPTTRSFTAINATVAAVTFMDLDNVTAGVWEIGVFGYRGGAFSLQVVVVPTAGSCVSLCSNHGTCHSTTCSCNSHYSGSNCETYTENLQTGSLYAGYSATGMWNYWHVHYFTESSLVVNVTQSSGDCDLYIRQGQNPTRIQYQLADLGVNSQFSLTIQEPGDDTWYLGVYGWTSCEYSIEVNVVDDCQCVSGSHGHCSDSTQCICDMGYAGSTCTEVSYPLQSGMVLTQQFVAPSTWKYYYFVSESSAVSVTMTETASEGFLWLMVSMTGYPTGENVDYYDTAVSDFHEVHIVWYAAPTERMYFIGVVPSTISIATEPLEFSITVYGTPF